MPVIDQHEVRAELVCDLLTADAQLRCARLDWTEAKRL